MNFNQIEETYKKEINNKKCIHKKQIQYLES